MSLMNDRLLSATGSFGLESAHAMVMKSWREYQRCKDAASADDRRDAAINCAITLWHLNDWVWNGIAAAIARDEPDLKALLGISGRRAERNDLVKWAVAACPELNVCQAVCNGSKHVVCNGIKEARISSLSSQPAGNGEQPISDLEIVDNSGVRDAIDVLFKAAVFWTNHATNENVLR